jgi:Dyp-type peroxidase family
MHSPPVRPEPALLLSCEDKTDIQGFITSGFGHLPAGLYLFLRFTERTSAKAWLRRVADAVTSARSWRRAQGEPKRKPEESLNVGFTPEGLRILGLPPVALETFPADFLDGMSSPSRSRILGDVYESDPQKWEFGREGSVHVLLILFASSDEALRSLEARHIGALNPAGIHVVAREVGELPAHGKEHFGFRDGVSKVVIRGISGTGIKTGEFILGHENEYGYHPVTPLVRVEHDPQHILADSLNPHHSGYRDFGRNGTFVVYRKYEQHVAKFWQFLQAESRRLNAVADPEFMIWLAAKMVGRWPGGAPLTLSPDRDDPRLADTDAFFYADIDRQGFGCPFGSHVRRTQPRDMLPPAGPIESLHMTARHRLLRRGRIYGAPLFDLRLLDDLDNASRRRCILNLKEDGQSRGIHFLCINASIRSQFEFVQQAWANNPHFAGLHQNRDPLVGSVGDSGDPASMHIPRPAFDLRTSALPTFVTVRAGAYFFMPSIRALRYLATPSTDSSEWRVANRE